MTAEKQELKVGVTASLTKTVTAADVETFAAISGDNNPIHLDEEYAATTRFGKRIAHGALVASYISAVLGSVFPGTGSIYLSQSSKFKAPVYMGDTITTTVEVVAIREDKPVVTFNAVCENQDGQTVIEGQAVLLCPQFK